MQLSHASLFLALLPVYGHAIPAQWSSDGRAKLASPAEVSAAAVGQRLQLFKTSTTVVTETRTVTHTKTSVEVVTRTVNGKATKKHRSASPGNHDGIDSPLHTAKTKSSKATTTMKMKTEAPFTTPSPVNPFLSKLKTSSRHLGSHGQSARPKPPHSSHGPIPPSNPIRSTPIEVSNKHSSSGSLSPGTIAAFTVPLALFVILAIILFFHLRRRKGKDSSRAFSDDHHYQPAKEYPETSYNGGSMVSTTHGSLYDSPPRALLGADPKKLWPLTIPQNASRPPPELISDGVVVIAPSSARSDEIPPPPLPKDNQVLSLAQRTKPQTPLRAAWRRAHGTLKRSRALRGRSGSNRSSGSSNDSQGDAAGATESTPVAQRAASEGVSESIRSHKHSNSNATARSQGSSLEGEPVQPVEDAGDGSLHPVFREGSFEERVAPRTPKSPGKPGFDFGFPDYMQKELELNKPLPTPYAISEPDFGEDGLGWENVDIESPYQPPDDMYQRLSNPVAQLSEDEATHGQEQQVNMAVVFENTSEERAITGTGATETTVEPELTRPANFQMHLSPPVPMKDPRPASSIYSEHIPSRGPSAASNRNYSTAKAPSRFAERGLRVETAPLPTPPSAREYQDMLAWPMPLNVSQPSSAVRYSQKVTYDYCP